MIGNSLRFRVSAVTFSAVSTMVPSFRRAYFCPSQRRLGLLINFGGRLTQRRKGAKEEDYGERK
ncbi:MAG: hypothetical protein DMG06_22450 [Acidobacteria bacterium]|nr:MAG: hypothetical protein DMG06_22450 [Acidobacteriota bacterium]